MRVSRHLLTFCLAALASAATAQTGITEVPARESAPVIIANRNIIVLRGPIAGYSARERAQASMRRIDQALEGEGDKEVTTATDPDGTQVLIGSKLAFLVTRIDIEPDAGETTQNVAREAARRLQRAMTEFREQRTPRYLAIAAGWTLLATLVYLALLRLFYKVDQAVGRRFGAMAALQVEKVHVHGVSVFDAHQIRWVARRLVTVLAWALGLFATYTWVSLVLKLFPYTRPWGEEMEDGLFAILRNILLGVAKAIPGVLVVILIVLLTYGVTRVADLFFQRIQQGKLTLGSLDADTVVPTRRLFQLAVWAFALALAYPYLPGAETEAFKGVSVLLGVMVSIGASSLVGQAASGLILMYTRAFRLGEFVRIGETQGTVVGLGAFATRIRTGLGDEVLLPNSYALQNTTHNYSRSGHEVGFLINTGVTIGYATPWRQVHAMLEEAARRTQAIATDPLPYVRQTALSDFYVDYRLIAYAPTDSPEERADILSRLHANIQDVFNENGVQILSPHYMMEPREAQIVPKARWWTSPAQKPGDAA
jgi:small-conductance mechanosensitive channel